jgi:hypothetical protein
MSYILVTTRKTLVNPQGEARYLVNRQTETTTTDIMQAARYDDSVRCTAVHADLNNPANWDAVGFTGTQGASK